MAVPMQMWLKTTRLLYLSVYSRQIHVLTSDSVPEQLPLNRHRRDRISQSQVLNEIKFSLDVMNQRKILQALKDLRDAYKDVALITNDPVFADLCQKLKKYAPTMSVSQVVEAIRVLSSLDVPINTYVFQTLLQMIRCNINLLDFHHIRKLDPVLAPHVGKSHLADAIKRSLPLVFETHFPLEFDSDDIPRLVTMLSYSSKNGLHECVDKIIDGFLMHNILTLRTSKEIVNILCEYNNDNVSPNQTKLLHSCLDVIAKEIYEIKPDKLLDIIDVLANAILKNGTAFYHPMIFDAAADFGRNTDIKKAVDVAVVLAKLRHTNIKLAEYLRDGLSIADAGVWRYIETNPRLLFDVTSFLSYSNFADVLKLNKSAWLKIVMDPRLDLTHSIHLHFCLQLACLNIYEDNMLVDLFSKYDGRVDEDNVYRLLVLCEAIKKFHNIKYNPSINITEKVKEINHRQAGTIAVKRQLEEGFGGDQYLQRNVLLPNGIFVDMVVCLRDGKLLETSALSETRSENGPNEEFEIRKSVHADFEPSRIPFGSRVVCILVFGENCYSRNCNRLQSYYHLILRILERDGYGTLAVNATELSEMPECERTPYIMRELSMKYQ